MGPAQRIRKTRCRSCGCGHRQSEEPQNSIRRRLRGLLRNLLLGALVAREGNGGSESNGGGSEGYSSAARDLVYVGRHPTIGAAQRQPYTDSTGQVQSPAQRWQG